jgi:hypothetical protein
VVITNHHFIAGRRAKMDQNALAIKDVIQYIIERYPESCFAENALVNFEDYVWDSVAIPACVEFFYEEKLNWCGCGSPEIAQKAIRDYLKIQKDYTKTYSTDAYNKRNEECKKVFGVPDGHDNPLILCLSYALDKAGFTEHGSGIGGAWLTKEGEMFLHVLTVAELENDDE